jgi:hypothetical protein
VPLNEYSSLDLSGLPAAQNDSAARRQFMTTGTDISALYREFTDALTEVLAENAGSLVRMG